MPTYIKTNWINNITPLNQTNMNNIENGIEANANAINTNTTDIGDKASLDTTDKSNLVGAVNEVKSEADTNKTNLGQLSNLDTANKDSAVAAINEVNDGLPIAYTEQEIATLLEIS